MHCISTAKYLPEWTLKLNVRRWRNPKHLMWNCGFSESISFLSRGNGSDKRSTSRKNGRWEIAEILLRAFSSYRSQNKKGVWDAGQFLKSFDEYDDYLEVWMKSINAGYRHHVRLVAKMDWQRINQCNVERGWCNYTQDEGLALINALHDLSFHFSWY